MSVLRCLTVFIAINSMESILADGFMHELIEFILVKKFKLF